jgi:hypothetical protein
MRYFCVRCRRLHRRCRQAESVASVIKLPLKIVIVERFELIGNFPSDELFEIYLAPFIFLWFHDFELPSFAWSMIHDPSQHPSGRVYVEEDWS